MQKEVLINHIYTWGMPPTLIIYKDMPFDYFQITFESGSGASWGLYDNAYIYSMINRAIDINLIFL